MQYPRRYIYEAAEHAKVGVEKICAEWRAEAAKTLDEMFAELGEEGCWQKLISDKHFYAIFVEDLDRYAGTLYDVMVIWNERRHPHKDAPQEIGNLAKYELTKGQRNFLENNRKNKPLVEAHKRRALGRLQELVEKFGNGGFFKYFTDLNPLDMEDVAYEIMEVSEMMDLELEQKTL